MTSLYQLTKKNLQNQVSIIKLFNCLTVKISEKFCCILYIEHINVLCVLKYNVFKQTFCIQNHLCKVY